MKTRQTTQPDDATRETLEARFALRVTAHLNEGHQGLPHDISERLRIAREQAVQASRQTRRGVATEVATTPAIATSVTALNSQGVAALGGWDEAGRGHLPNRDSAPDDAPVSWGWRLANILPIVALVVGLWLVHAYHDQEKVEATADIDTAILLDDLPPDAYADPGFEEFLREDDRTPARPIEEPIPEADGDLSTTEADAAEATP